MRVEYEDYFGRVRVRSFRSADRMWDFVKRRLRIKYGWAVIEEVVLGEPLESPAVKRLTKR